MKERKETARQEQKILRRWGVMEGKRKELLAFFFRGKGEGEKGKELK